MSNFNPGSSLLQEVSCWHCIDTIQETSSSLLKFSSGSQQLDSSFRCKAVGRIGGLRYPLFMPVLFLRLNIGEWEGFLSCSTFAKLCSGSFFEHLLLFFLLKGSSFSEQELKGEEGEPVCRQYSAGSEGSERFNTAVYSQKKPCVYDKWCSIHCARRKSEYVWLHETPPPGSSNFEK